MEAFARNAPQWTKNAIHAIPFCCPRCKSSSRQATKAWLNRNSPVMTENYGRKWQEFYLCECEQAWWAWSTDRISNDDKDNQQNKFFDSDF